jgi:lipopolysaccharide biosynthesis glycosyltransferase
MKKSKNAVVTLTINKKAEEIAKLTHNSFKSYSDKIGADFVIINKKLLNLEYPHFEKFQLYNLLDKYDRILYIDTDAIILPNCPNIFKLVKENYFGALFEENFQNRDDEIKDFQDRFGDIGWKKRYFNSGVMVISRQHKEVFNYKKGISKGKSFKDQTQLNYNVNKLKIPIFNIGLKFNHIMAIKHLKKMIDTRFRSYIIHYAGYEYWYKDMSLLEIIKKDLEIIKKGKKLNQ